MKLRKVLALLTALLMLCVSTPFTFVTAATIEPTLVVSDVQGAPGDTVSVTIRLENNPGLVSAKVKLGYDSSALELIEVVNGDFQSAGYSYGDMAVNPFVINFCYTLASSDYTCELLATVTFKVKEDAEIGVYPFTVICDYEGDFYNLDWDVVEFAEDIGSAKVICTDHIYDEVCDPDCNRCGVTRDVHLNVEYVQALAPICNRAGHVEHWFCPDCKKLWLDEALTQLTDSDSVIIPATSVHSYSADCDRICNNCGEDRSVFNTNKDAVFTDPTIVIEGAVGYAGDTVTVPVYMKNNPGIVSTKVSVGYDNSVLELVTVTAGDFSASGYSYGEETRIPFIINWCDTLHPDNTAELLATLTFKIKDNAPAGSYPLTLTYDNEGDIYNLNWDTVYFGEQGSNVYVTELVDHTYDHACDADCNACGETREVEPHKYVGKVTIAATCIENGLMTYTCETCGHSYTEAIIANGEHTYDHEYDHDCNVCKEARAILGDVNGDGKVNNRDLGILQQHLNGRPVTITLAASDVNDDGKINNRDLGFLQQYLNGRIAELL